MAHIWKAFVTTGHEGNDADGKPLWEGKFLSSALPFGNVLRICDSRAPAVDNPAGALLACAQMGQGAKANHLLLPAALRQHTYPARLLRELDITFAREELQLKTLLLPGGREAEMARAGCWLSLPLPELLIEEVLQPPPPPALAGAAAASASASGSDASSSGASASAASVELRRPRRPDHLAPGAARGSKRDQHAVDGGVAAAAAAVGDAGGDHRVARAGAALATARALGAWRCRAAAGSMLRRSEAAGSSEQSRA